MVRSLLRMCNQLAHYRPEMSILTLPIRELLTKGSHFKWLKIHEDALDKIKAMITGPLILRHFDKDLTPIVYSDSSYIGLGWALIQFAKTDKEEKFPRLIMAGGRTLAPNEKNFSVSEIEMLGLIYAL